MSKTKQESSGYISDEGARRERASRSPSPTGVRPLCHNPSSEHRAPNPRLLHPAAMELPSERGRIYMPHPHYHRLSSDEEEESPNRHNNNNNKNNNNHRAEHGGDNKHPVHFPGNTKPSFMICDILSDSKFKAPLPGAIQLMRSANSAFTMAGPNSHRPDYSPFEAEDGLSGPLSPLSGSEKRKYEELMSDDEGKANQITNRSYFR